MLPGRPAARVGPGQVGESARPLFSVIVPTRNRAADLALCLEALAGLSYPRERYEVIVVDDGGGLPEASILAYRGRLDVRLVWQTHTGQAAARNRGARLAAGAYLAFTDDDCRPGPDWLARFEDAAARAPGHLFGGPIETTAGSTLFSLASDLLTAAAYTYFEAGEGAFFSTSNLAVPADGFRSLQGFDETMWVSEDRELSGRLAARGFRLEYVPDAVVLHAHHLTFGRFCAQRFRFGRGARLHEEAVRTLGGRTRRDMRFYLHLLRYPFSRLPLRRAVPVVALFAVAQAANASGYAWERWIVDE